MAWRTPLLVVVGAVLGYFLARAILLDALEQIGLRLAIEAAFGNGDLPFGGKFSWGRFLTSSIGLRLEVGIVTGAVAGGIGGWRLDRKAMGI